MPKKHCRNCKFFKISWDPNKPYACSFFDFKSKDLPMNIVKQSSGSECTGFSKKASKKNKDNPYE